jgi:SAM-dependent methyltransferase
VKEAIYQHPADYDLEHEGDDRDVRFYRGLMARLRPKSVLEFACGSARLTLPLAAELREHDGHIVGVEVNEQMLDQARSKLAEGDPAVSSRVRLEQGDMRRWRTSERFDVVLIACSSITHLLTLEDQLAVWRNAFDHLETGGRLLIDVTMPDLGACVGSLRTPPRALTEIDLDQKDPTTDTRLIRQKTTRFDMFAQRADIQFLYDKFEHGVHISRYASDFASHLYFPRELTLLFLYTGFTIEAVWADYAFRPASSQAREIVMVGAKKEDL